MRRIDEIIVHCADTPPDMDIGAAEIRQWHLARGFRDIGYHAVIRRSGIIEWGRREKDTGAHVRGHNAHSLGICLIGGAAGRVDYTRFQWATLDSLVGYYLRRHARARVIGHHDHDDGKTCPNFDVQEWAA